jgi:hypothetical protein
MNQAGKKYSAYNKKKAGWLDWPHLALELYSGIERKTEGRIEVTGRQGRTL